MSANAENSIEKPRLGGVLGALFWIAVLIVAAVIALAIAHLYNGGIAGLVWSVGDMVSRALEGGSISNLALRTALLSFASLFVWAVCMVAFTLTRSRMGPLIISIAFAAWVVSAHLLPRLTILGTLDDVLAVLVGMVPAIVTDAIIILAFVGYMFDGARPRSIYRN